MHPMVSMFLTLIVAVFLYLVATAVIWPWEPFRGGEARDKAPVAIAAILGVAYIIAAICGG